MLRTAYLAPQTLGDNVTRVFVTQKVIVVFLLRVCPVQDFLDRVVSESSKYYSNNNIVVAIYSTFLTYGDNHDVIRPDPSVLTGSRRDWPTRLIHTWCARCYV